MATELRDLLTKVIDEHGDALLNAFVHQPTGGMVGLESARFLAEDHEAHGVRVVRIDLMGGAR